MPAQREHMRQELRGATLRLAAGTTVGLLAGFSIGGLGGRLAMLLLRLTSPDTLRGVMTDDGFVIGSVTGATVFLLGFTAVGGAAGGAAYVALRRWLPARLRAGTVAVLTGITGGAVVVDPHGADFTALAPRWLAVALFVALPAAYGATVSWATEKLLPPLGARPQPAWAVVALLLPVLLVVATGLPAVVLLLIAGGWVAVRRWPLLGRLWWSPVVTYLGRAGGLAGAALAAAALAGDVRAIL